MSDLRLPAHSLAAESDADRLRGLPDRLRRGDETAVEALIDRYWDPLVAYARGILGSADAAEDVVQEAFIRLWKYRRRLTADASIPAFLYAATRNLCLNEKRRRSVRARFAVLRAIPFPTTQGTPLENLQASELEVAAQRAIEGLPARRREVFKLARHHGLAYREIAEVLQLSPQTVANQMSAALEQLRAQLGSYLDRR